MGLGFRVYVWHMGGMDTSDAVGVAFGEGRGRLKHDDAQAENARSKPKPAPTRTVVDGVVPAVFARITDGACTKK